MLEFSRYHRDFLDIVFGKVRPVRRCETDTLPLEEVYEDTLYFMEDLVIFDFDAPWQKEIANVDESGKEVARNPYHVFPVEPFVGNKKAQKCCNYSIGAAPKRIY